MKKIIGTILVIFYSCGALYSQDELPWRIEVRGGYTALLGVGESGAGIDAYCYDMTNGAHLGFDAAYYFDDYMGLGFRFAYNKHVNSFIRKNPGVDDILGTGLNSYYVAPSLTFRVYDNMKNIWYTGLTVGCIMFDKSQIFGRRTVAFGADVGYERRITREMGLGCSFTCMVSRITTTRQYMGDLELSLFVSFNAAHIL